VTQKDDRIAELMGSTRCEANDYYAAYFECFNRRLFFEAHEVLEKVWLPVRHGPNGAFYKGLIQLAGAFVHVQKKRPGPAKALLKLARQNLINYPEVHERLNLRQVLETIDLWLTRLDASSTLNPGLSEDFFELRLGTS
jgi:predicted metal-dependent hydrolase